MPRPLDWVDQAVPSGGTKVYYLGQSIDAPEDVLQLEFWNRKVQHVWSTDGTAPGPGATLTPDLVSPDGRLEPASGVEYIVADSGVSPIGRVLERKIDRGGRGSRTWTLVKIAPPLRLRQSIEGIYPDGWGKPDTALNQFSFADRAAGTVNVHVFRTGAARRYPATVRYAPAHRCPQVMRRVCTALQLRQYSRLASSPCPQRTRPRVRLQSAAGAFPGGNLGDALPPRPRPADRRPTRPRRERRLHRQTAPVINAQASRGACARSGGCRASARACGG